MMTPRDRCPHDPCFSLPCFSSFPFFSGRPPAVPRPSFFPLLSKRGPNKTPVPVSTSGALNLARICTGPHPSPPQVKYRLNTIAAHLSPFSARLCTYHFNQGCEFLYRVLVIGHNLSKLELNPIKSKYAVVVSDDIIEMCLVANGW